MSKRPRPDTFRNLVSPIALADKSKKERVVENSVYQARWLLGPLFGLCIGILGVGVFLG
jgi:hypothetical protein